MNAGLMIQKASRAYDLRKGFTYYWDDEKSAFLLHSRIIALNNSLTL